MTDEIPDDVVERARKIVVSEMCTGDGIAPCCDTCPCNRVAMAVIRVAVEWEREQCARVADEISEAVVYNDAERPMVTYADAYWRAAEDVAAAIRSRK